MRSRRGHVQGFAEAVSVTLLLVISGNSPCDLGWFILGTFVIAFTSWGSTFPHALFLVLIRLICLAAQIFVSAGAASSSVRSQNQLITATAVADVASGSATFPPACGHVGRWAAISTFLTFPAAVTDVDIPFVAIKLLNGTVSGRTSWLLGALRDIARPSSF